MILRSLSALAMIANSEALLAPPKGDEDPDENPRSIIEQFAILKPHLETIQEVHDALLALSARNSHDAERLAKLRAKQEVLDDTHDDAVRFSNALLTAAVTRADADDRIALETLAAEIQPQGDALVNASYMNEAGAARVLDEKLDKPMRGRLASIALIVGKTKVTLLEAVEEQVAAGLALGKLETQKRMLEGSDESVKGEGEEVVGDDDNSYLQKVHAARLDWMQTVQLFVSTVERTKKLPARQRAAILGVLEANRTAPKAGKGAAGEPGGGGKGTDGGAAKGGAGKEGAAGKDETAKGGAGGGAKG